MQVQNRLWNTIDNVSYAIGRVTRNGNGVIRSAILGGVLIAMFLYPLANM